MSDDEYANLRALVGQTIAERYLIEGLLGVGGMGAVFRAQHRGLKREVALKILHPELCQDDQISARFDREAQSASRLDHPNCVQVTDFGSWTPKGDTRTMKYMVMQLLQGQELADVLERQPLDQARVVKLVIEIFHGLAHAHEHGIVHRDLKPENIFMTTDHEGHETLKLVDFGIAKIVSGEGSNDQMTRAGLVFGTPAYMSPEQATGSSIDERTDLYSCGIILYEMLAGHPPFQGEDPIDLVRAQIGADPPPLPDDIHPEVRALVNDLLAKRKEDRIQTARQALDRLEAVAPILEVSARAAGQTRTPPTGFDVSAPTIAGDSSLLMRGNTEKPVRRTLPPMWMIGTGGALALSTLVGICVASRGDGPAPASTRPAAAADDGLLNLFKSEPEIARAPADEVARVDKHLVGEDVDKAHKVLQPLLDRYPQDPALLWRRGRILKLQKGKSSQALASYKEALERETKLLENKEFYAELSELLRDPKLLEQALDLALQRMGERGHPFLLELVNREENPLGYVSRHRSLDALENNRDFADRINRRLNNALDLWQAEQSLEPCANFEHALEAMEDEPDPYYLGTLEQVSPPTASGAPGKEDPADCEDLEEARQKVLATHEKDFGTTTASRTVPGGYGKKKQRRKRRSLRNLFSG